MHVDFDYLVVVNDHHAVAERLQEAAQLVGVFRIVAAADELRAVGVGDLARGEVVEVGALLHLDGSLALLGLSLGDIRLAAQDCQRGLEDENVALAARVHDARVLGNNRNAGVDR